MHNILSRTEILRKSFTELAHMFSHDSAPGGVPVWLCRCGCAARVSVMVVLNWVRSYAGGTAYKGVLVELEK